MDDLINRSKLIDALMGKGFFPAIVRHVIEKAHAVDAVEIVRCKDCKHLYDGEDGYCCHLHKGLVKISEDSFCSYGERKKDEHT